MAKVMNFRMTTLESLNRSSLRFAGKHSQLPKCQPSVLILSSILKQQQQAGNFIRSPENGLKIRSEREKKHERKGSRRPKKIPNNESSQFRGGGLAVLGALKSDLLHKDETQTYKSQNTEQISGMALQGSKEKNGENNYESLLPNQTAIKDSEEVNKVFSSTGNLNEGKKKRSLSGQDILLAMQKASVEKAKETRKSRRSKQKIRGRMDPKGFPQVHRHVGEVRPITIKNGWLTKIENLEKRLQEVKQKQV